MESEFSAKSCVHWGWETFKKRPWFFALVFLVVGLLSGGNLNYHTDTSSFHITPALAALFIVAVIIGVVIKTLVNMGKTNLLLKAHADVAAVSWRDLWSPHPFWRFLVTSVVYGLIVFVGFILLIVPGIIWGITYMFAPYVVMDRGSSMREALGESARITKGHKWELFWFGILLGLINLLGLLCLVVGLLVSVPVTALATVYAYRTLQRMADESPAQSTVTA